MPDYQKTLQFLFDLQLFGIKVGLNNISHLLQFLGNPHSKYPCIHIAGTNGKGSTAAMIASVLTASGYRTGLYTSPHLVQFNERIRIDGKNINDKDIVRYTKILTPQLKKNKATFFEATTAMAFQYFADQNVDIAVIETGLGGRLDATNIVDPILSIITNIGLEHVEYLGSTLERIAFEKGGIIKRGIPCITGATQVRVLNVLRSKAHAKKTKLLVASQHVSIEMLKSTLNGLTVDIETKDNSYRHLKASLAGEHQSKNLRLAISAVEYLKQSCGFSRISKSNIVRGLSDIQQYSGIHARMEMVQNRPLIITDVCHNADAAKILVASLRKLLVGKIILMFGVMKDKNYSIMTDVFRPITRLAIAVSPQTERALKSSLLVNQMHISGMQAIDAHTVMNGLKMALNEVREKETILVTGSHYVVGEALRQLKISA